MTSPGRAIDSIHQSGTTGIWERRARGNFPVSNNGFLTAAITGIPDPLTDPQPVDAGRPWGNVLQCWTRESVEVRVARMNLRRRDVRSRWRWVAALAVGAVIGLGCRGIFRSAPVGDAAAAAGETAVGKGSGRVVKAAAATRTGRLIEDLVRADAGRCEQMFREMTADGAAADALELEAVFARWVELAEPREILTSLKSSGVRASRWAAPFFEAWAAADYAGAMAATVGMGDFSGIRALVAIRRADPAILQDDFQIRNSDNSGIADALTALGRTDPELAKDVATAGGSRPDENADIIVAIARGWAERDPAAALEWVKSLPLSERNRTGALDALFSLWLKNDLPAATKAAGELAIPPSGGVSSDSAVAILRRPESALSGVFLTNLLDPFASVGALHRQLARSPVDWSTTIGLMRTIDTEGWFAADPAKAAAEAAGLPPGGARDFLLSSICAQWADRSPAEATAFATAHDLKPPRVKVDPPAEQLGAEPAMTLAPLFSGGETTAADRERLTALEAKWAQADPRAAADWLIAQPDFASFGYATDPYSSTMFDNSLGYYWARIDAKGAARWVEKLPDGPRRNRAWQAVSPYVREYSPDLAFTTSAMLVGDASRMKILERNLEGVASKVGLPAAREILDSVYITGDERASLLKSLENPTPAAK